MLGRYSNSRTFGDNLKLGVLTAFIAGMVNVASLVLFYSFTSNLTGHFAILSQEISNGNWFQMLVVLLWISLYFSGSFLSGFLVISSNRKNAFVAHAVPLILEITAFVAVGVYGQFFYKETLVETELLVAVLLFAMGLQNGLTSSISNFQVKTTHLTGITTDLAIHVAMLLKKKFTGSEALRQKATLMAGIIGAYLTGGTLAGLIIHHFHFQVFYYVSAAMVVVLIYDYARLHAVRVNLRRMRNVSVQQAIE